MRRLVIVSNRVALPGEGAQRSGGLVTGVVDALHHSGGLWFGWSGKLKSARSPPRLVEADGVTYATVDLTRADYDGYYSGLSNAALWPLFHYRLDLVNFTRQDFAAYLRVNALLADTLAPLLKPNDLVWVHDYHLIPMAEELRRVGAAQRIGFFLHTPFPSLGVLAALPHYLEILKSLCAYDLVGFQTIEDLTAFHDAIVRRAGGEVSADGRIHAFDHDLRSGVFPIGVDPDAIADMAARAVKSRTTRRLHESLQGRKLIIGVDRLDYSKGLEHRFKAFACFLEDYPEQRNHVRLLQNATATRSEVPEYCALRQRLGALAGDVAGRYARLDWAPIQYLNRSFSQHSLAGFFRISSVALVTPLRDGMNLVAKEYVAAQNPEDPGVLILSPFAGAAYELDAALIANPFDPGAVAEALQKALQMPIEERRERWRDMMEVLHRNNITAWRESFLGVLGSPI
ncbi:trehalose-6-phosphate synthase [Rhodoblastus acidophilus]|uniref:alpha,alpha-trehalose-phosphate synthase (UDP-forming) n=1 Tax=Candidatus Rhodoblastus alkanivorans TaxID=2954117 RepID=UPI001FAA0192|nr:trehalose-6-phosphate synthase [Candidatus Rhodoblastus alkanivorans]MCI4679611.1 trehalose-6-phosphate synthase [Candidatus Rhodoblastus alkanivorans]MDI4640746.1 trehalose-6-phosphate synthase [Rhodoblastus acidophilus]